jgi:homoserine dehydrogenase
MRVGLVGLGTIGSGVVRAFQGHGSLIAERLGFPLELTRIADVDLERERGLALGGYQLSRDWREIVDDPDIDLVVELVGGTRVARDLVLAALAAGKHVVTANKALLAQHGREIFALAAAGHRSRSGERGGRFPCCAVRGPRADRAAYGIVNGACSFTHRDGATAGPAEACLKRARTGFAEVTRARHRRHRLREQARDPGRTRVRRVSGAVGVPDRRYPAHRAGRHRVRQPHRFPDQAPGRRQARRPRHRGARASDDDPAQERLGWRRWLDERHRGARRALRPDALLRFRRGVAADRERGGRGLDGARACCDATRVGSRTAAGTPVPRDADLCRGDQRGSTTSLHSARPPGVPRASLAPGAHGISIASVLQEERHESRAVPIVITTHESRQADLDAALAEIAKLREVVSPAQSIRIEREL